MKNFLLILFFLPLYSIAQSTHTVAPKESFYSIGRQYNVHPKELAAYNNLSLDAGLSIGQVIKIPSKVTTASPKTKAPENKEASTHKAAEKVAGTIPIYHKVEKKETLYHISKLYKDITIDDLKKWNKLTSDGLTEGANLIVGFQKGTKETPVTKPVVEKIAKANIPEPAKEEVPAKKENKTVIEAPVVKETTTAAIPKKEIEKEAAAKVPGAGFNGGFFKKLFLEQTSGQKNSKEESGTAAIFKTTSGWEDGRYYCLHNDAPSGSILKITNKSTQRTVYAKVLDVIPDLKQNTGILLRLSNAAADELGSGENNFECIINY